MENDTIAAISTPVGEGGIAVIRVSGPEAVEVVDRVYKGKRSLTEVDTHTVHYGHILHPETKEVLDEVLVTVMRAPRTFTREDVVEMSCHGGVVPVQKVLEASLGRSPFGRAWRVYQAGFFERADRPFPGGSGHRFDPFQNGPGRKSGDVHHDGNLSRLIRSCGRKSWKPLPIWRSMWIIRNMMRKS